MIRLVLVAALLLPSAALALDASAVLALLKEIDERQRNVGDWKVQAYIDSKEKGKNDIVYDAVAYRRDKDDKLMILFLQPKSERGKGYLRVNKNLWFYDPRVGKWERRTERERIGGTQSNRQDFDDSKLHEEFVGKHTGDEKLGRFDCWVLELEAKPGKDVAYPKLKMWVDKESKNILKREDYAASGKKMRRALYPQWTKIQNPQKGAEVWFPKRILIFDEIEKDNRTDIRFRRVDLSKLPASIFTKAWLESQSR